MSCHDQRAVNKAAAACPCCCPLGLPSTSSHEFSSKESCSHLKSHHLLSCHAVLYLGLAQLVHSMGRAVGANVRACSCVPSYQLPSHACARLVSCYQPLKLFQFLNISTSFYDQCELHCFFTRSSSSARSTSSCAHLGTTMTLQLQSCETTSCRCDLASLYVFFLI